jgi:hypothetical protein
MSEINNNLAAIKRYLNTAEHPITMEEFKDFWNECTEEEKKEFKQTKLE